ncbi:succinic semialdehyde dehydrogenase [Mycobacterium shimoidei]|uniref:Putative succinate-semialdehyde dehydrogenase [NADP(+)] 2 n=1 Tax=Mycobacterium shimoidei TaxID=29313 RepID=A0A1E3TDB7_MYCSH|nr:succinic semialdehyde dehydrogenase [Mycobacterium shimoidei]MCV7258529.1 succinate-semialdehyde dehydrogenase (NADP(+)) [Mycobacterium shimoidei]ODR12291.1 succinic semialdehyde dehydrogenase [Mycobacterium shimoidei]ORW83687.1 succinate-semialdehyde dehydrogenase [Mycobacterium shimoidei]SRX92585.1 succinic semialdehyde dehydrogenase [Gordonia sp. KTR9] [Mycobacterium shimoidei]
MTTTLSDTTVLLDELAGRVDAANPDSRLEVTNAMTGQLLGSVPRCTSDDVIAAAERGRAVQRDWANRPIRERAAVLRRFHDLVLQHQDEVLDLIQLENGKARRHAFEEVMDVCVTARYYANTAEGYLRPKRRQGVQLVLTQVTELHHPKGLVGIISPWNYPLTLGISDAIPAIVAGNAVLAKPDQQTPFSALWAVRMLEKAGMPAGLVQVVTGSGAELGTPIIEQSDYLMFTGSTATGRTVAAQAGQQLIDCSMELGGKNALLVLDDADVDKTVSGAVRAAFSNAGQLCISVERIYVPGSLWDDFAKRYAEAAKALKLSAELDYSADMGSLISEKQLETVRRHVDDAVSKGAEVLAGGRARPDIGPYFYEPTILSGVREGMTAFADETFGPVVSLYRVDSEEEAIAKANDSDYGLNFSVWTSNAKRGRDVAARLQAGTVNVNEAYAAAWGSVDAPMGGMKASGLGRRHGEHGILKYTESQTIAVERLLPVGVPPGLHPRRYARIMSRGLRLLKHMPGVK